MIQLQQHPRMTAHVEAQGNLLAIKGSFSALGKMGGGRRGIVTSFSQQSRLRMLRKVARLAPGRVVFVTLTYPQRFPSALDSKKHLRAFLERIRRRFPQSSAIWRLEYQQRGAPHFHLMFFDLGFLPFAELRRMWSEIINAYVDDTLPRVRIELVRSRRGIMFYVAKYCAKVADDLSGSAFFILNTYLHAGRWWGVFNKFQLPFAERFYMEVEQITWIGFQQAKLYLEQFSPSLYPNVYKGKVVFTSGTSNHFRAIYELLRQDFVQTFVRRFDQWEHEIHEHKVYEAVSLPFTPHLRVGRVHLLSGAGIYRTRRPA